MNREFITDTKYDEKYIGTEDLPLTELGNGCQIFLERLSVFEVVDWNNVSDYDQLIDKAHYIWLFSQVWVNGHNEHKGPQYPVYVDYICSLIITPQNCSNLKQKMANNHDDCANINHLKFIFVVFKLLGCTLVISQNLLHYFNLLVFLK